MKWWANRKKRLKLTVDQLWHIFEVKAPAATDANRWEYLSTSQKTADEDAEHDLAKFKRGKHEHRG